MAFGEVMILFICFDIKSIKITDVSFATQIIISTFATRSDSGWE